MIFMKKKKNKFSLIFNGVMLIVLCISLIFYVIGLINTNGIILAIVGAVIIVCQFAMSVEVLIKRGRLSIFDWVSVAVYYTVAISFVCFYLAAIPDDPLRNVTTSIASATIGGLLTLMGVGITIKYARIEKEEDEIKKCIPRVFPISPSTWDILDKKTQSEVLFDEWKSSLKKPKGKQHVYCIGSIYLATTDLSMCVYDGIMIDDKELLFDYGIVLQKDHNYELSHNLRFSSKSKPKTIHLLLTDMLDNTYKSKMSFEIKTNGKKETEISITSILNTQLYIRDNKIN